ncbi:MAG: hypothetical protein EXR81_04315 [Gammaproteobacteria bacterium]|nr:hypothetical protein [Gammaproteobacteria bacterium]
MRLEDYDSYNQYCKNNIMLDQGVLGLIRGIYVPGELWDHPYISPMRGDLAGFPKTFIMIGSEDPLYDENIAFSGKITQESLYTCEVLIGQGMPHHYHTFIGLADAVEEVYQSVKTFVERL